MGLTCAVHSPPQKQAYSSTKTLNDILLGTVDAIGVICDTQCGIASKRLSLLFGTRPFLDKLFKFNIIIIQPVAEVFLV